MVLQAIRGSRRGIAGMLARIVPSPPEPEVDGVPARTLARERATQRGQRHFGAADLDRLERLCRGAVVMPLGDAHTRREDRPERLVALRHDLDHDIEQAVRMARWEAERGLRSTYFVLHTEWYWGTRGPREPSPYVLRALDDIAGLGHEIGVHNNAVAAALRTGRPPASILADVLDGLRAHGFAITGTAAHGDPLARRLGFVNYEMFRGCPSPDGKPPDRVVEALDPATHRRGRLRLEPVDMAAFGLEYEAYFLGHTRYLSEAEGRWNHPPDDVAAAFGREGGFLQVLTHPVHWAFDGEDAPPVPARP
jgi:hypothetical protein